MISFIYAESCFQLVSGSLQIMNIFMFIYFQISIKYLQIFLPYKLWVNAETVIVIDLKKIIVASIKQHQLLELI
jgi:hypothetical protein